MNYEKKLSELALKDKNIVVMTSENRAPVRSLPDLLGNRFIDTGITEQCMIGASAGLALRGKIVVAHALASFLVMRAYEFIRTDIGIGRLPVKLVGFVPGLLSDGNGPTHQAIEDISLLRSIPGMRIFCPSDNDELVNGLEEILYDPFPWYIRYNISECKKNSSQDFSIGVAEDLDIHNKLIIITYGFLFNQALIAKEKLEKEGINIGILNLRTIQPIDKKKVVGILKKSKIIITLEDHFQVGGIYSIISEICLHERISPEVFPISLEDDWFKPGLIKNVLEKTSLSGDKVCSKIKKILNK